jgi:hypothetical protein
MPRLVSAALRCVRNPDSSGRGGIISSSPLARLGPFTDALLHLHEQNLSSPSRAGASSGNVALLQA